MVLYLDSSAITKLVKEERESDSLRAYLVAAQESLATSALTSVELIRAVSRVSSAFRSLAVEVLAGVEQLELAEAVLRSAASIDPPALRTLDAIHVASALALGEECSAVITYDVRMAEACRANRLEVVSPGREP